MKKENTKVALGIGCALLLSASLIVLPLMNSGKGEIDLSRTESGIRVYYEEAEQLELPRVEISYVWPESEQEIFEEWYPDIIRGTVVRCRNIEIDYGNGNRIGSALIDIRVEKVYKGGFRVGETVTLKAGEGYEYAEETVKGAEGIFLCNRYTEDSYATYGGETLMLADIADGGLSNRFNFLDSERNVAMHFLFTSRYSYCYDALDPMLSTLDDVEAYMLDMLPPN